VKLRAVTEVEVPEPVGLALLAEQNGGTEFHYSQPFYFSTEGHPLDDPPTAGNHEYSYRLNAKLVWEKVEA